VVIEKPIAKADKNRDFTTREHAAAISSQARGPQLPFLARKIIALYVLQPCGGKSPPLYHGFPARAGANSVTYQNKFFFLKASLSLVLSYNYCWE